MPVGHLHDESIGDAQESIDLGGKGAQGRGGKRELHSQVGVVTRFGLKIGIWRDEEPVTIELLDAGNTRRKLVGSFDQ